MEAKKNDRENIQLGGNIELRGFSELSGGDMIIIKKIVGNHVKRITELTSKFENIKISLKTIHEIEDSKKFEIKVHLIANGNHTAEVTERNIYVGIDKVLKKIISIISS
jgi:ribosome-associated translation inhibitor RaiA